MFNLLSIQYSNSKLSHFMNVGVCTKQIQMMVVVNSSLRNIENVDDAH